MSYTPPPYAPPKKGTNPLVWVFVALGAFCCIAVIGFGAMTATVAGQVGNVMPCMMTMSLTQNSILAYEKENGKFPAADSWQDDISEIYNKRASQITSEVKDAPLGMDKMMKPRDINGELLCNDQNPKTYLVYNSEIAGKKLADLKDASNTVLFFETTKGGKNVSSPYVKQEPKDSPKMMGQPRGWNIAYADGMVEFADGGKSQRQRIDFGTSSGGSTGTSGSTPAPTGE